MDFNKYNPKPKLTPGEIIQGIALKYGQGALFGMEKPVAGIGGVLGEVAGRIATKQPLAGSVKAGWGYGVKEAGEAEERAEQGMPVASTIANIVGSISPAARLTGLIKAPVKQGIGEMMKYGAKAGALAGGAYGAGSGLGEVLSAETGQDAGRAAISVPLKAGMGALTGAGIGALAPAGIAGIAGAGKFIKNVGTQKGINYLLKNLPKKTIEESVKKGIPLTELGEINTMTMAGDISRQSRGAANILLPKAEKSLQAQPVKIRDIINKHLGGKSKLQNIDEIEKAYKEQARPLYEKAMEAGDLGFTETGPTNLSEIMKNPKISEYASKARRSELGIGTEDLPNTHMKVIDATKQEMDDKIGSLLKAGEKNKARALNNLKKEMVEEVDKMNPDYASARSTASDRFRLEDAQESAKKMLKSENVESMTQHFNSLNPAEKEAFKVGIRDELMNQVEGSRNEITNLAKKIFGDNPNYSLVKKIKLVLGDEGFNAMDAEVDALVSSGKSASHILSSQGTGATLYRPEGDVSIPLSSKRFMKKILGSVLTKGQQAKYPDVAELMSNPKYLASEIARVNTPERQRILDIITNAQSNIPGIAGMMKSMQTTKEIR